LYRPWPVMSGRACGPAGCAHGRPSSGGSHRLGRLRAPVARGRPPGPPGAARLHLRDLTAKPENTCPPGAIGHMRARSWVGSCRLHRGGPRARSRLMTGRKPPRAGGLGPVQDVGVATLQPPLGPRQDLDLGHVELLAQVLDSCPPIEITPGRRVIKGWHRVAAARLLGRATIKAVIRDDVADETDELVMAVESNTHHGLPLTRAERRSAAERILLQRPQFSNARIAQVCGVSRGTIRLHRERLAERSGGELGHLSRVIGTDGRTYPGSATSPGEMRSRETAAQEMLRDNPGLTVRDLASQLGVSVGTAARVRQAAQRALADAPALNVPEPTDGSAISAGTAPSLPHAAQAAVAVGPELNVHDTNVHDTGEGSDGSEGTALPLRQTRQGSATRRGWLARVLRWFLARLGLERRAPQQVTV